MIEFYLHVVVGRGQLKKEDTATQRLLRVANPNLVPIGNQMRDIEGFQRRATTYILGIPRLYVNYKDRLLKTNFSLSQY